ncbi:MAG: adenylate/guanylate cyclase domain-containing protein [Myxococcota bacterium]
MSAPELQHRLAAILSAEGEGYTRLLAEDEAETIRALGEARELISASVSRHRGRVVDAVGDNLLAEFPSAVDAVRSSLEVQRVLDDRVALVPARRRLRFRIGLHLGDVAVEDSRIYGDGVNVAARLQTLAEPGGICLSGAIHDSVRGRLDLTFVDLGEQSLKNFPRPVRVFRIGGAEAAMVSALRFEPPDRPSLVVLPFANVSGDAEQEFFADGMTEDLIAELARVPELFVIGRGTSFSYKGKSVAARELGRELGVRHVVEGSVRRAGSRVRITARLTDAQSARETWSERYDRELGDVFALQDEVVGGVVAELRKALGAGIEHAPRGRPVRADVWELLVHGRAQLDLNSPAGVLAGTALLERCVALDARLALARAELGRAEYTAHLLGIGEGEHLERGIDHILHALELDPDEPFAHLALGIALTFRADPEAAVSASRRALELAPGRADVVLAHGMLLNFVGRQEEAIPVLKSVTRVDPAQRYMHLFQIAICYRRLGRVDEAIAKHRESIAANPVFLGPHMNLAAIYANLGQMNQARASLAEVMRLRPDFSIAMVPRLPTGREFLVEGLRKAGLKE